MIFVRPKLDEPVNKRDLSKTEYAEIGAESVQQDEVVDSHPKWEHNCRLLSAC
jgi:hypothetical protein